MYDITVKTNYKKKKKRNTSIIGKVIFMIILISSILLVFNLNIIGSKPVQYQEVEIKSGETLWSIASRFNSGNTDPRKMVYQIKKVNNLEDSLLQPGQAIKVPVSGV